MATLKLKKKPTRPSTGQAPPGRPTRPPVRGSGVGVKRRPTLDQAQAERAQREARYQQAAAQRRGDRPPPRPGRRDEAPFGNAREDRRHPVQRTRDDRGDPLARPQRPERPRDEPVRDPRGQRRPPERTGGAFSRPNERGGNTAFEARRDQPPRREHTPRRDDDAHRPPPGSRPERQIDPRGQDPRRAHDPARRDALDTRERRHSEPPRHAPSTRSTRDGLPDRTRAAAAPGWKPSRNEPARYPPREEFPRKRPAAHAPRDEFPRASGTGHTRRDDLARQGTATNAPRNDPRRKTPAPQAQRDQWTREAPPARQDQRPRPASPGHRPAHEGSFPDPAPGSLRLSKRISELGLASRREADEWIERGWVRVDGRIVNQLGSRVLPGQHVTIDPRARKQQDKLVTILLNKPVGYVSGQAEDNHEPAIVLVKPENHWPEDHSGIRFEREHLRRIAPAGRLDIDSVGLLVFTQDGRIAKQLIGEDSNVDKEYLVRVEPAGTEPPLPNALTLLNHGLELDGEPLRPAQVEWLNEDQLRFVLREGKKRQIRRMCEAVGLKVTGLKRVRIGQVRLGDLPAGRWRYLRADEGFE